MSLLQRIKDDQIHARKNRDRFRAAFLTTLFAECQRPGLDDGKRDSTDDEVVGVLKKFIKNGKELQKGLVSTDPRHGAAKFEIEWAESYLPAQLSEADLIVAIESIIKVNGFDSMKNMGSVMKELKDSFGTTFDARMASRIVKEQLG